MDLFPVSSTLQMLTLAPWNQINEIINIYITRTRWRRVKTLGQHQIGVNFQSDAQHQLWISTWCIIMNSTKYHTRLKLACKFSESKYHPYWDSTLATSHDTGYVLDEHIDFSQHDPNAIPSEMILWYSYSVVSRIKLKAWLIYCINERIWH